MLEMHNQVGWLLAGFMAVCSTSCGADHGASDGMLAVEVDVPVLKERVLAEFESGGERHAFLLLGEEPDAVLSHRFVGSVGGSSGRFALASAELPPTLLETFLALAPAGLDAPPELVARHAQQARALGRTEEVRPILVEKQRTPPPGVDVCDPSLFFDAVVGTSLAEWATEISTSGLRDSYHCAGGPAGTVLGLPDESSCTFLSQLLMMVGVCARDEPVLARVGFGSRDVWSVGQGILLDPSEYMVQTLPNDVTPHRMAAVGQTDRGVYGLHVGVMEAPTFVPDPFGLSSR
jgi:hypothetical protein